MSRINVGKVAPIPKGVWSSTATYEKLNLVNKGGILYIAKVDNIPAGTPVTNTDYWMKATNSLSIGTITPVESISEANASIEDTNDGQVLNLDIPYGVISTEYIDDTAGEGDTNKIWSADKTQREINNHINKSASGSIVTLTDAMDAPVSDMVVAIEPFQEGSGDPSPDNVRAITGWDECNVTNAGKNLLINKRDRTYESKDVTFTKNDDGSVTINGTASGTAWYNFDFSSTINNAVHDIRYLIGKTITFSFTDTAISGIECTVGCFLTDGTQYTMMTHISTKGTMIVPDDAYKSRIYLQVNNGTTVNNVTIYPQLELGSTATAYEPYNSQTVTIDLGGTRYGGTLDVPTGVLTVDYQYFVVDGITKKVTNTGTASGYQYFITSVPSKSFNINSSPKAYYSNEFKMVQSSAPGNAYIASAGMTLYIYLVDQTITTVDDANTWLSNNNAQFAIPLAEPLTYQLTPAEVRTILNLNNIWSDTGEILSLDYMTSNATSLVKYIENQDDKNIITKSAESGSIAHFYNSADAPLAELKIGIKPVQDLHGYDAPWPAGGGNNIWDEVTEAGGIDDATGEKITNSSQMRSKNYFPCLSNTSYYVAVASTSVNVYVYFYDSTYTFIGRASTGSAYNVRNTSITTPSNCAFMLLKYNGSSYANNIAINYPSTVTTYSPYSNICPITGWDEANVTRTGKNLVDICSNLKPPSGGLSVTANTDGSITLSGTPTGTYFNITYYMHELIPAGTYTFSISKTLPFRTYIRFKYKDGSEHDAVIDQPNLSNTITLTEDATDWLVITSRLTTGTAISETYKYQLELGSTATAYEPYQGQTATIDLGGTRYGGVLDVTSGVLTVDKVLRTLSGTENFSLYNSSSSLPRRFAITLSALGWDSGSNENAISNVFRLATTLTEYRTATFGIFNIDNYLTICDNDSQFATVADLKSWFATNATQICYSLATPITIQIDPTNLRTLTNENFVWVDTGDILSLDYYTQTGKTTAEAIDAVKTNAIYDTTQTRSMITQSSESTMVASKNYTIGDLLIINNQLLRAKSNILSGTTITIGTSGNCEVVDLATVIAEKSVNTHTHDNRYYTESEIDTLFAGKDALKSASGNIVSINDATDTPAADIKVAIEPVQDLHGYDNPWPGGGGKNLLPMTVAGIKAKNTDGTWNGNTYTRYNVTFTILTDNNNNIIGIKVNGTAEQTAIFTLGTYTVGIGNYTLSGCPSNGSASTYYQDWRTESDVQRIDTGSGNTYNFPSVTTKNARIVIANGATVNNIIFYPMIETGSSKTTFAPYSNICPITGWDEANVTRTGKNLFSISDFSITHLEIDYAYNANTNTITFSGTCTNGNGYNAKTIYIPVTGSYNFSAKYLITGPGIRLILRNKTTDTNAVTLINSASSQSVVLEKGEYYFRISGVTNNVETSGTVSEIQLELGSSATTYEPYQSQTVTIDLGSTRYGGSLNVPTGVLTVDRVAHKFSDFTWSYLEAGNCLRAGASDRKLADDNIISSVFPCGSFVSSTSQLPNKPDNKLYIMRNNNVLFITYRGTAEDFITNYGNETIVYPLAEPFIVQLTPAEVRTLLGLNNVWADTGDVDIVYYTDTDNGKEIKRTLDTINHKIALLQSQIDEISQ